VRHRARRGEGYVAYVAVQYARFWGVAGASGRVGSPADRPAEGSALLRGVREAASSGIRAGMTLDEAQEALGAGAGRCGLDLAPDVPPPAGVGFDLREYPTAGHHRVGEGMVLQVTLAADDREGRTVLDAGMLLVDRDRSRWLAGKAAEL
jgi:hypothetical protein